MDSWEVPYLCLAKYVKSRDVMQPCWITAPVQKSSLDRGVSGGGEPPFSTFPGEGWLGQEAHPLQPGKEPAVHWASLTENKELLRGLISIRKQGKALPKMSLALFLAHLWNVKYLDSGSWPNSLKSQLKKPNMSSWSYHSLIWQGLLLYFHSSLLQG